MPKMPTSVIGSYEVATIVTIRPSRQIAAATRVSLCGLVITALAGCATKATSNAMTGNDVIIRIDSPDPEKQYRLTGITSGTVATGQLSKDSIVFHLPDPSWRINNHAYKDCYAVVDSEDNIIEFSDEDNNAFQLPAWDAEVALFKDISDKQYQENQIRQNINNASNSYNWLQSNPDVFIGGLCVTPPFAPKPALACSPDEENTISITACAVAIGGCSMAADYVGHMLDSDTAGFLSGQSCEATAAQLYGGEYGLSDLLGSAIIDQLGQSSHWLAQALAGAGRFYQFGSCIATAKENCSEKYTEWSQEPYKRAQQCQAALAVTGGDDSQIRRMQSEQYDIRNQINKLQSSLVQIRNTPQTNAINCSVQIGA